MDKERLAIIVEQSQNGKLDSQEVVEVIKQFLGQKAETYASS